MSIKIVAKNKKARRNYEVLETFETGIVLHGSEVKSLREGKAQINEAHARFENGELWALGLHIAPYSAISSHVPNDPTRKRKLLLHKNELIRIFSKSEQQGLSIIPLVLYFKKGKAKLEIGLGKGKKTVDKRQDIAKRDADREARRALSHRSR